MQIIRHDQGGDHALPDLYYAVHPWPFLRNKHYDRAKAAARDTGDADLYLTPPTGSRAE